MSTPPGKAVSDSAFANVAAPSGTSLSVVSFVPPGATKPVTPSSGAVPIYDPASNTLTGSLVMQANGGFVFTPVLGFVGRIPAIPVTIATSSGLTAELPLSIRVNPPLLDGNEVLQMVAGDPALTSNLLANTIVPVGSTAKVASFTFPGATSTYPAGAAPVAVFNPATAARVGTVSVLADGTATFTPAPGFTGQVPSLTYTVACSDGQIRTSAASISVLPSECHVPTEQVFPRFAGPQLHSHGCLHTKLCMYTLNCCQTTPRNVLQLALTI